MRLLDLLTSPKAQGPLMERKDGADSDLHRQSVSLDRLMRHRVSRTWSSGHLPALPPMTSHSMTSHSMTSHSRLDPDLGFQATSSDCFKDIPIQDRDGNDAVASLELGRMLWSNVNLNSAALSSAAEAASGMDDPVIGQDDRRPSLDGSESDFKRDPSVSSPPASLQLPVRKNLPNLLSTTERDEWNAGIDAGWNAGIDTEWNNGKDAEWNCGIDGEWPDGNRDVIVGDDDDDCFKLFDSDSLKLFNFNFVGETFDEDSNHCDVYNNNIATPSTETTKSTGPPSVESMNDYNIDSLQDLVDCVESEAAGAQEPASFDEPKSIKAVDNFVETKKEYQNRLPWNQDGYRISSSTNQSEVMKLLLNNTRKIVPHHLQASSSSASVSSLGSKLDAARKRKNNRRDKPNTAKRSKVSPPSESSSIKSHEFSHQQQQMMAGANSCSQNFDSGQRHLAMCIGEQDLASTIDNGIAQSWMTSNTSYFDDVTAVQDDVYNYTIRPTGNLVLFLDNFHDLVKLESEQDMTLNLTQLTPEDDVGSYSDTFSTDIVSTESDNMWTSLARYGGNCIKTEPGASEEIPDLSTDHDYCQNAMNAELCLRSRLLRFDWSSKDGGCPNEALKNLLLDTNLTEKVKRDAEVVRAKSRKLMTTTAPCDTVDIYSF